MLALQNTLLFILGKVMNQFDLPNLYGIIGYPLEHTLSPFLHTSAFKARKIPALLLPWQTPANKLSLFVDAMRLIKVKGCCVTIPHKRAIISLLDDITPQAKAVGAVNCLYWKNNALCGDNTDVIGFMDPLLSSAILSQFKKVLLLGSGGGARAVIVGLKRLGYSDITVTARHLAASHQLANEFNIKSIPWPLRSTSDANFIINSTALGMSGELESQTPYLADWFKKRKGLAYDIVYTPIMTRFCQEATAANWHTISGLDMFFAQANAQFVLWTGQPLPKVLKEDLALLLNTKQK